MQIYIDGYNLLFTLKLTKGPLEKNRKTLLEFLSQHPSKTPLIIVFDGHGLDEEQHWLNELQLIFTAQKSSADQWIEEKIASLKTPQNTTVVTNDRELARHCKEHRAIILSQEAFLKKLMKKQDTRGDEKLDEESSLQIERLEKIFTKKLNEES